MTKNMTDSCHIFWLSMFCVKFRLFKGERTEGKYESFAPNAFEENGVYYYKTNNKGQLIDKNGKTSIGPYIREAISSSRLPLQAMRRNMVGVPKRSCLSR